MKKYFIQRKTPTIGEIFQTNPDGKKEYIRTGLYGECLDWLLKNQKELKTYKVARILHRKNAKRRYVKTFYVENFEEAVTLFGNLDVQEPDVTYQLLTGDWKLVASFIVVNKERSIVVIH